MLSWRMDEQQKCLQSINNPQHSLFIFPLQTYSAQKGLENGEEIFQLRRPQSCNPCGLTPATSTDPDQSIMYINHQSQLQRTSRPHIIEPTTPSLLNVQTRKMVNHELNTCFTFSSFVDSLINIITHPLIYSTSPAIPLPYTHNREKIFLTHVLATIEENRCCHITATADMLQLIISMMRGSQLARALQAGKTWRSLRTGLQQNISTKEQFMEKLSSKKYREILGIPEDRASAFRDKDLHRAYLNQVKKFHSDNVQSEEKKGDFQEITKCIIAAYDMLKKEDQKYRPPNASFYEEEEEVAQQLFLKSYNQIKYEMYAPGKEQMRAAFLEELQKRRAAKGQQQQQQQKGSPPPQQPPNYSSYSADAPTSSSDGGMGKMIALLVACGLLSIPLLTRKDGATAPMKEVKVREYTEKEYDVMQLNAKKILMKPMEQFYNIILKRRPHMLIYPSAKDPHILEQLTRYSIAPDIHLYEVPSKYFLNEEAAEQLRRANSVEGVEKYELTETKPNTLLTLSLEAERALHNVYVLADDVLREIKEKGSFTAPKVFLKYHGYIMVELRDKPFSTMQCYKNTKYISLFDLYFDYYSPIFFKRDHFREYVTGYEEEAPIKNTRYFGNVYLNYRKIPKYYLQYGEKIAIMRNIKKSFEASGSVKAIEQAYREAWENYYARFQKNWKQYCTHQSEGKIIY